MRNRGQDSLQSVWHWLDQVFEVVWILVELKGNKNNHFVISFVEHPVWGWKRCCMYKRIIHSFETVLPFVNRALCPCTLLYTDIFLHIMTPCFSLFSSLFFFVLQTIQLFFIAFERLPSLLKYLRDWITSNYVRINVWVLCSVNHQYKEGFTKELENKN